MIANAVVHLLSAPRRARGRARRPGAAAGRRRGVAAARAGGRGGGPLRDARRSSSAARGSASASWSSSRSRPRTGIPRVFADPDRFDLRRDERQAPPGLRARPARVHRDAPRAAGGPHRGAPACSSACPACGSIRPAIRRRAGWSSASRPSCACAGTSPARAERVRRCLSGPPATLRASLNSLKADRP